MTDPMNNHFPQGKVPMSDFDLVAAYKEVLNDAHAIETLVVVGMCMFLSLSIIIMASIWRAKGKEAS